MEPPWRLTARSAIAKPNPFPEEFEPGARKNGRKICGSNDGGTPGPWSRIETMASGSLALRRVGRATDNSTEVPSAVWIRACDASMAASGGRGRPEANSRQHPVTS